MKIVLTKEGKEFLEQVSTILTTPNGEKWLYQPFWYKHIEGNKYLMVSYEKLPDNVKAEIRRIRKGKLSGTARRKWNHYRK